MNKICSVNWKEFKIGELFIQDRWKEKAPKQNKDWNTRIVNEINTNNWLVRKVTPSKIFPWNAITISINYATNVFYQQNDFCASVNIAILQNSKMSKYSGLFIVSLLRKYNQQYDYTQKISKEKINNTIVKLPINDYWEPDREYMENYMKNLEIKCKESLNGLNFARMNVNSIINKNEWKGFKVWDLFDIHPTKAYKAINNDLFNDDWINPVVVNSGFNNGIGWYTNKDCTEKAWTITFTDTAAKSSESFFYHDNDFVWYSHVQGMYTKGHWWDKRESLFLISVIKSTIKGNYDFIKKMTRDEISKLSIKLPIDNEWNPNREYMWKYMKTLMEKNKEKLNCLN